MGLDQDVEPDSIKYIKLDYDINRKKQHYNNE